MCSKGDSFSLEIDSPFTLWCSFPTNILSWPYRPIIFDISTINKFCIHRELNWKGSIYKEKYRMFLVHTIRTRYQTVLVAFIFKGLQYNLSAKNSHLPIYEIKCIHIGLWWVTLLSHPLVLCTLAVFIYLVVGFLTEYFARQLVQGFMYHCPLRSMFRAVI